MSRIPFGPTRRVLNETACSPLSLIARAPQVDNRRVISGIIYVIRDGLKWKDVPSGYISRKTGYTRFIRWSLARSVDQIFMTLVEEAGVPKRQLIDSIHCWAHQTAVSLPKKGKRPISCSALLWTNHRRSESQTTCRLREAQPTGPHDAQ